MTEQQWLRIYRETVHPLFRNIAKRTGGNRELTEDIVQEAYLRALENWKRKKVPDFPLAWLNRVARNILVDYLRQRKRDKENNSHLYSRIEKNNAEDSFKSLETFWVISSLRQKEAKVLESFYYDCMSVKEIAKKLALSERAVEGRLRRARHSLRSLIPDMRPIGGNNEQNV